MTQNYMTIKSIITKETVVHVMHVFDLSLTFGDLCETPVRKQVSRVNPQVRISAS